ncbi:DDE superfamily endonuclease [Phytophthora infestans]|uniref:DDE superfamily endonuclease n=1 Tax=Phytophthora infestans TaxID=4787 RepID=A0A8S9TZS1_PHYIN|nr:DDE superfamily endonuclease [Phytophthora infestans]
MKEKAMRKRGRGAGPRLNDLQRLEIIHKHKNSNPSLSMRQLARDFGVNEKSIRRIINSAADIEARAGSSAVLNMRVHVHRRSAPRFPELEKTLAAWIDARERAKAEISPSVVIDKAKLVARSMGISPDQFKASWGWYDKFSKRYGIRTAFVSSAEKKYEYNIRETKSLQDLHKLMTQYDPEWIFTVEETSLFYDTLPFDESQEHRNRVTLVVSCNSTGKLTLPVSLIGKMSTTSTFPVPYFSQERAWLDRPTFGRWYSSVFVPFVRERTSKPVLLVVDGERPGHQGNFEDDGIRLVFLPSVASFGEATTNPKTWWTRPLEVGVISALKAHYKYLLVQSVMSYHNAPEEVKATLKASEEREYGGGVHFGHTPTLLDAARLLEQAWSQVPDDILEKCFVRANMVPPSKLLTPPAPPTGMTVLEEQKQNSIRYSDGIAGKIEGMLASSSLWAVSKQNSSSNLRDRIQVFMYLDADKSYKLQRQLQKEIHEALSDQATLPSTADFTDAKSRSSEPELESQIREILLGITDISSRLRRLPRSGADAKRLVPLHLEGCIAAADQIRRCIQDFDKTLHKDINSDKPAPN